MNREDAKHLTVIAHGDAMAPPRKAAEARCEGALQKRDASCIGLTEKKAELLDAGRKDERRARGGIPWSGGPEMQPGAHVRHAAHVTVAHESHAAARYRARRANVAIVRLICSGSCVEQMKKRSRAAFSSTAG